MENRTKILNMVAERQISVSEAEKLLNALGTRSEVDRSLHIVVDAEGEKRAKVNIKVPLRLVKAGVKFVNLIPEISRGKIEEAFQQKGVGFDLNELSKLDSEELLEALSNLEANIEDGEAQTSVRIFCR